MSEETGPLVVREAQWRQASIGVELPPALAPLPGEKREPLDPAHLAAVRLACGEGATAAADVTGIFADRGTVGRVAVRADAAAGIARALVVDDGEMRPAADLELAVAPPDAAADLLLAHLPEARTLPPADGDTGPWTLSGDHARLLASAAAVGERGLERLERGLGPTPEVLRELATRVRGSVSVDVVTLHGPEPVALRWLLTSHGWIRLTPTPDGVHHELMHRPGVRAALAAALAP